MGSRESDKTSKEKEPKTPPPAAATTPTPTPPQEPSSTATTGAANADWAGFQQAYSHMPSHGFMASSPQAPYMWGVQHAMPPYGTPPYPYVAMYPPGVYGHPSMPPGSYPFSPFAMHSPNGVAEAPGKTPGNTETDGKSAEVKDKLPIKRSQGSLGSLNKITGKKNEPGKVSGASANGRYSKSAESGSEGTSEGSDGDSQNGSKSGGGQDSMEEASQNGGSKHGRQNGNQNMAMVPISTTTAAGAVPATNLHIGMEYWASPASAGAVPSTTVAGSAYTAGSRDNAQPQVWLQDERELKKQRRKQSNRESARRSRLRKQAECDELAQRAEILKIENETLRSEVSRIKSEYEQLLSENASLKERLGEAEVPPVHEDNNSVEEDN